MRTTLRRLQDWYVSNCERVPWEGPGIDPSLPWEELYGVTIRSLDNPGWGIEIDLTDTTLESASFERYEEVLDDPEWLVCWRDHRRSDPPSEPVFKATCGPNRLEDALEIFLRWTEQGRSLG